MTLHPLASSRITSGAALLAVLWVISLLIALVAGASLLLTQDLESAASKRQIFRARMLAETGFAIAMSPNVKPDDPILRRQVSEDEQYEVQKTGEDGFINPNLLLQNEAEGRETFRRLFRSWGLTLGQCDSVIDCLLDWVDPDDFKHINGAESKVYGRNGMPFNRPFRSIEEMSMVRGMELVEQAYPEWRSWFSVFASGRLDVNEARPEVMSLFLGVDMMRAQAIRRARLGPDGQLNTKDDELLSESSALSFLGGSNPNVANLISVDSITKRYVVRVRVGDLERELSAVVRANNPPAILWMSEGNPIDPQAASQRSVNR
jgi:type II secretory pathway component PulK